MSAVFAFTSELDALIEQKGEAEVQRYVMTEVLEGAAPRELAKKMGVTYADLWRWLTADDERFQEYQRMLVGTADDLAHESLAVADEADNEGANVNAKKLRVETRMKLAGKWDRHRYGESMDMKVSGSVSLIALLSTMPPDPSLPEPEAEQLTENPPIEGESQRIPESKVESEHGRNC